MKTFLKGSSLRRASSLAIGALLSLFYASSAIANLNIPSDGSDGALVITNNTVIDLSQAISGNWNTNNSAHAGRGVYDPTKWAVVFKYSSVVVEGGATVTFKNHASRAPVVWLVQGDVAINGTVGLNGADCSFGPYLAEPGPGGSRGGSAVIGGTVRSGAGFGVGGGSAVGAGGGGSYGSSGSSYGSSSVAPYGNPSVVPLIGGSGGGGREDFYGTQTAGGGAGGGAILIAAGSTINISGQLLAIGGLGITTGDSTAGMSAGSGSGGAIRLIARDLVGNGRASALGGARGNFGGIGRIRVERVTAPEGPQVTPDPSVVVLTDGATPQIWMPDNGPSVRIISIGGNTPPADPRAGFGVTGPDTVLPRVNSTTVVVETTNVEQAAVVTVRATPRASGNFNEATASPTLPPISEDPLVIRWTANVPVNEGYSAIQVKVVRP